VRVNGPSHKFLAESACTANEHRCRAGGDPRDGSKTSNIFGLRPIIADYGSKASFCAGWASAAACQLRTMRATHRSARLLRYSRAPPGIPSVPPSRHWRGLSITTHLCIGCGFQFLEELRTVTVQYRYPEGQGRWAPSRRPRSNPQHFGPHGIRTFRGQARQFSQRIWSVIIDDEHS